MLSIILFITSIGFIITSLFLGKGRFAFLLVALTLLTNIISIAIYYLAPVLSDVRITIAMREISIYFALLLTLILVKKFKLPAYHPIDRSYYLLFLTYVAFIIVSMPKYNLSTVLMGRELIFPLAVYFLFRFLNLNSESTKKILYFVIQLAFFNSVIVVIEQVYVNFFNTGFWEQINIAGYLSQKYGGFSEPYPGSWINYLPGFIGLTPGFRSIGIMLDPLVTGHFLASSFTIVISWYRGRFKWLLAWIIGVGAICTFSKATMLIIFVAIGSQALRIRPMILRQLILGLVILAILGVGLLLLSTGDDNFTHFGSFKTGLNSIINSPLGHGVGSTGYLSILMTGGGELQAIDTSFSVYIYQMGIIGLIALFCQSLLPFFFLYIGLRRNKQNNAKTPLLPVCLPIFGAYTILAFSSAAAFTAVPIFIPMMLLGMHVSINAKRAKAHALASVQREIHGKVQFAK